MFKTKKQKFKKIILSLLMAFAVVNVAPGLVTHAAIGDTAGYIDDGSGNQVCDTAAGFTANPNPSPGAECIQTSVPQGAGGGILSSNQQVAGVANFLIGMQEFLNRLVWPLLFMIGGLLDNSILFGAGMEERLREIWVPIRNIVNILFVVAMVGIAIYNVLGLGEENSTYSIKAILPKLIIGIIAINVSFLGIKVFLDAVNVFTVSIFALPDQVSTGLGDIVNQDNPENQKAIQRLCLGLQGTTVEEFQGIGNTGLKEQGEHAIRVKAAERVGVNFGQSIPTTASEVDTFVGNQLGVPSDQYNEYLNQVDGFRQGKLCDGDRLTTTGQIFLSKYQSQNAALALALNMGKIVFYEDVKFSVSNLDKLMVSSLFSVLLYLVYIASFVALFIVLLARLVVLWLAIALSPVLLISIAVPAVKEKVSVFGEISEKFVQNALAPLGIALSMSIGWIMLKSMQSIDQIGTNSAIYNNIEAGIPIVQMDTMQDLLVALGTVAVVWMGVFTAASKTIAAKATDFLKESLQKVGSFIATAPLKYTPFIPIDVGGGGGQSQNFTGAQVMQTFRDIGALQGADNRKLTNILGLGGSAPPQLSDMGYMKDAAQALDFMATHRNDMHTKEFQQSLKSLPPEITQQLSTTLARLLEDLKNTEDEETRKDIVKQIFNQPEFTDPSRLSMTSVDYNQKYNPQASTGGQNQGITNAGQQGAQTNQNENQTNPQEAEGERVIQNDGSVQITSTNTATGASQQVSFTSADPANLARIGLEGNLANNADTGQINEDLTVMVNSMAQNDEIIAKGGLTKEDVAGMLGQNYATLQQKLGTDAEAQIQAIIDTANQSANLSQGSQNNAGTGTNP